MTLLLPLRLILLASISEYSLVFSVGNNSFRHYELRDGGDHGGQGERYTYQNGRSSVEGPGQQGGPPKDDNQNPIFPPRSDAFWESDKKPRDGSRGGQQQQPKRVDPKDPLKATQGKSRRGETHRKQKRPNIILILTDDQDIELGSMEYMPETLRVFRENGVEFRHGYVTTPMCCPSRTSMLTGLYVHNHQVYTNNDNCSSILWREKYEAKTFAAYLQASGYYTSYIGKYLNKYDGSHIPIGWNEWNVLLMNSRFYNYTVNRNGQNVRYGHNYERDYYPDSIANDTVDFLRRMATPIAADTVDEDLIFMKVDPVNEDDEEGSGSLPLPPPVKKSREPLQPFLLVVSFPSPHGPEDSAPQYSQLFLNETPHHTPAYNFAPNADKQWILQVTTKMNSNLKNYTNLLMAKRLQTLQSVDSSLKAIMETLKSAGFEDDTYVFYTSDHGYHVGQFGLIKGKAMPYEFDIRVPFFIKAPKDLIPKGTMILEPVLNIDLAPTFLDLAGVPVPDDMDGRSIVPLLQKYSNSPPVQARESWTQTFLIESSGRRESGSTEQKTRAPHAEPQLQMVVSEDERGHVDKLCDMHSYPCVNGQRKYCRREKDRVRFRKCRVGTDFVVEEELKSNTCQCPTRTRRDVTEKDPTDANWESERQKIDAEIEALKTRIDELREKKRLLKQRQQWTSTSDPPVSTATEQVPPQENESTGKQRTKKKNQILVSILPRPKPTPLETSEVPSTSESIYHKYLEKDTLDIGELEKAGHAEHGLLDDDLFISPVTFVHSEEEDDEDEMISKLPNNHQSLLNTTIYMANTNGSQRRNRNRGQDSRMSVGNSSYHEWKDRGEAEGCDCTKLESDPRWLRLQEREDRKQKKLMSKLRKKQRFLNRIHDPSERQQASTCGSEDKMNCFWHDKQHWRTMPLWEGESFCFCMNSNNNTFSCLRSINSTHNYLYCHFVTGFKMYFDLGRDPFQLRNAIGNLASDEEDWMLGTLLRLKQCQGHKCHNAERPPLPPIPKSVTSASDNFTIVNVGNEEILEPSIWEKIFGTRFRRKRVRNGRQRKVHSDY